MNRPLLGDVLLLILENQLAEMEKAHFGFYKTTSLPRQIRVTEEMIAVLRDKKSGTLL